jgi:hypothetical protein
MAIVKLITIQEGVLESNFDAVINPIISKNGSFSEYLYQEFGLDETKLKELRNKYTVAV